VGICAVVPLAPTLPDTPISTVRLQVDGKKNGVTELRAAGREVVDE